MKLPTKIDLDLDELWVGDCCADDCLDDEWISETICDWLSDTYGFCHDGFSMSIDRANNKLHIYNIMWDTDED